MRRNGLMASLLSKFLGLFGLQRMKAQADPNNPAIWSPIGGYEIYAQTASGEAITVDKALSVGAFYAGVKFISQTIGMAPINMYRRIDDKSKEKAPAHPLHHLLHSEPSPYWTPLTWKQQMTSDAIVYGNGYSLIHWDGASSFVKELQPLRPWRVRVAFESNGEPVYLWKPDESNEEKRVSFGNMFHLPGFGNNFCGLSTVVQAKEAIALALSLEQHATRYFSQGAVLGGTIEFPETVGEIKSSTYDRLRASFNRDFGGVEKHHLWKILEYGAKANPLSATNVESQFLEARRFVVDEMARWLGLRPHTLGQLERAIKSNIEEQARELLMFDLLPWFVKWEQVIKRDLIIAPQKYFAEFNVDMLLRGDTRARWEAYKVAIEHGVMSPDEVRAKENFNPREDGRGSIYWEPQANFSTAGNGGGGEAEAEAITVEPLKIADSSGAARTIAEKTVESIVRKEMAAIERWGPRHASKNGVWEKWLTDWYKKHQACLVERLALPPETARTYCLETKQKILEHGYQNATEELMPERRRWLVDMAIGSNGDE
jgi:HK97 family phage portal protein